MLKIFLFIVVSVTALSLLSACGHWGHWGHWRGHGHRYSMNSDSTQFYDRNGSYS